METLFYLVSFAFILCSFALVILVPINFAFLDFQNKNFLYSGLSLWVFLVFLLGVLNSFVV